MKITLCGSTRFQQAFGDWNAGLTLAGHVVYGLGMFGREAADEGKVGNDLVSDDEKVTLDLVHLRKIIESDVIVVLNVGGYVGISTRREIQWANMNGRAVYWLENNANGKWLGSTVWQLYRADNPTLSIATVPRLARYVGGTP